MGTYYSPKHQIPAPDAADLIVNGPHQFKAMVDRMDDLIANIISAYGLNKVRYGSAVIGHLGFGQYVITLPAGVFTNPPIVVVSNGDWQSAPGDVAVSSATLVTPTQFQVTCAPWSGDIAGPLAASTSFADFKARVAAPTYVPGPGHLLRVNWIATGI